MPQILPTDRRNGIPVPEDPVRISVLVPSRARPDSIYRLATAFWHTCGLETYLHVIVDDDDPELQRYSEYVSGIKGNIYPFIHLWIVPRGTPGIVHPVNFVSDEIFRPDLGFKPDILGFMGDDHLPKTEYWDFSIYDAAFELKTGIIYGNDLFQGEALPTAAFLTRDIVQTLGYLAPPELNHLYVDNFWLDLGKAIGKLKYLDSVHIEHLHPGAGKSEWDQTYAEANSPNHARDRAAYEKYKQIRFASDVQNVLECIREAPAPDSD